MNSAIPFSPLLGGLTAIIELALAVFIFLRVRTAARRNTIILLLGLLAGYQILEIVICMSTSLKSPFLSRLAFLDITWLPPLGLLLMLQLSTNTPKWIIYFVRSCFALASLMSVWILLDYRFITGTMCEFVYAKYTYVEPYFHFYGAFYEISQMSLVFLPALLMSKASDESERKALCDLQIGTLLFILPSVYLVAIIPGITGNGLPSIMCHFAFFFACFLGRIAMRWRTP